MDLFLMELPETLHLNEGILHEATWGTEQIVLWLPGKRTWSAQEWERVSSVPRTQVQIEPGIGAVSATAIEARQPIHTFMLGLILSFGKRENRSWALPNGQSAERFGERRRDLLLVWSHEEDRLNEDWIKSRWPDYECIQQLGKNLYLVAGVKKPEAENGALPGPALSPQEPPIKLAEEMVSTARRAGVPNRIASALTDLGIVLTRNGSVGRAVALFEEALNLVRQSGDRSFENDVLDNLGMAVLTAGQSPRALTIFQEGLEIARLLGNPFAEKMALMHLGMAYSAGHDPALAIIFFDQALTIARQLHDRQHEADLLWQLGIVHAEAGQRDQAIARAQQAVALFKQLGNPQADWLKSQLQKYQAAQIVAPLADVRPAEPSSASVFAGPGFLPAKTPGTSGPGLLRMAFSAMKSMARFAGSGFKTTPTEVYQKRLQNCASCDHHTGLRCRVCGCFTHAKASMPHETCPIGKWKT